MHLKIFWDMYIFWFLLLCCYISPTYIDIISHFKFWCILVCFAIFCYWKKWIEECYYLHFAQKIKFTKTCIQCVYKYGISSLYETSKFWKICRQIGINFSRGINDLFDGVSVLPLWCHLLFLKLTNEQSWFEKPIRLVAPCL